MSLLWPWKCKPKTTETWDTSDFYGVEKGLKKTWACGAVSFNEDGERRHRWYHVKYCFWQIAQLFAHHPYPPPWWLEQNGYLWNGERWVKREDKVLREQLNLPPED